MPVPSRQALGRWTYDGRDHAEPVDDPTIRRCMGFAKREGCGGIIVINQYALRTPNPQDLYAAKDPHGEPLAGIHRRKVLQESDIVVAAWGSHCVTLDFQGVDLMCLGRTKDGSPRHPLYVRADQKLEKYS